MEYRYEKERESLLTDEGQRLVLKTCDTARGLLKQAGAVRMDALMGRISAGTNWRAIAVVDRLVELGILREVGQMHVPPGQHRIFVSAEGD